MQEDAESSRLRRAQQLFAERKFADAAKLYQAILCDHPDHIEALHRLGVIAGRIGMPERAIRLLRQTLRSGGETAELLNDLGTLYVETDDPENAARCFLRCREKYPDVSLGYISGAYVENSLGNFDRALEIYQLGRARVPDCVELQFNLATFFRERGKLDQAVTIYNSLIDCCPDLGLIRDGRARCCYSRRNGPRVGETTKPDSKLMKKSPRSIWTCRSRVGKASRLKGDACW